VFRVLAYSITAGEIEDIRQAWPRELNALWPVDAWLQEKDRADEAIDRL
jgi:hypothetical protein